MKALREGKRASSWLDPDERYERRVQEYAASLREALAPFARRLAELGHAVSLGQTLLKLTAPGVPDLYQGDELESIALVDPDNRRAVDWERRRRALARLRAGERPTPGTAKLFLVLRALELRARRPEAFEGDYEPVEAGPDVCAFVRGGEVLVAVPLRPGARFEPPAGWRDALGADLPVALLERGPTRGPAGAARRTGR
jgi:(1->4)-alpha-D-glucan 1-alpha-D-glucosylmutase